MQINNIHIRRYRDADFDEVSALFRHTIRTVNLADYTAEQCAAWIDKSQGLRLRRAQLAQWNTQVAERDGKIVGFGSIDAQGCLEMLYVHAAYMRQGIAGALCDVLEKDFDCIATDASVTAQPFFLRRGYVVCAQQTVDCGGVSLCNARMQKSATVLADSDPIERAR